MNKLYEQDFNLWIHQQINLLKLGNTQDIDIEHLILELADMGKSHLRELNSRLIILITHLLKWQFQLTQLSSQWIEYTGKSWSDTIIEQRTQVDLLFEDMPSLRRELADAIRKIYPKAIILAMKETGLSKSIFPIDCPYSIDQLLDIDFYPKNV